MSDRANIKIGADASQAKSEIQAVGSAFSNLNGVVSSTTQNLHQTTNAAVEATSKVAKLETTAKAVQSRLSNVNASFNTQDKSLVGLSSKFAKLATALYVLNRVITAISKALSDITKANFELAVAQGETELYPEYNQSTVGGRLAHGFSTTEGWANFFRRLNPRELINDAIKYGIFGWEGTEAKEEAAKSIAEQKEYQAQARRDRAEKKGEALNSFVNARSEVAAEKENEQYAAFIKDEIEAISQLFDVALPEFVGDLTKFKTDIAELSKQITDEHNENLEFYNSELKSYQTEIENKEKELTNLLNTDNKTLKAMSHLEIEELNKKIKAKREEIANLKAKQEDYSNLLKKSIDSYTEFNKSIEEALKKSEVEAKKAELNEEYNELKLKRIEEGKLQSEIAQSSNENIRKREKRLGEITSTRDSISTSFSKVGGSVGAQFGTLSKLLGDEQALLRKYQTNVQERLDSITSRLESIDNKMTANREQYSLLG